MQVTKKRPRPDDVAMVAGNIIFVKPRTLTHEETAQKEEAMAASNVVKKVTCQESAQKVVEEAVPVSSVETKVTWRENALHQTKNT